LYWFDYREEIKDSPEKITSLLSQKKYLEATQALVRSLDRLSGDLKSVDGLVEVKEVLANQRESLYNTLLDDLSKQLYTESTWEVLQLKRQDNNPFLRSTSNRYVLKYAQSAHATIRSPSRYLS
jgi:hypothetical protein